MWKDLNKYLRTCLRNVLIAAFGLCCFLIAESVFAAGDIAGDATFNSNVTVKNLEPDFYHAVQADFLKDIALLFNSQYVTGEFTEADLPDIFAFVSKYPGWMYSMALLGSAVEKPELRDRTISFAIELADKNPRERRLQLAMAEILIKYKRVNEAYKYLERAFELAMENPDSAPEEFRKCNASAVSKYILLFSEASSRAPENLSLRKQLRGARERVEAVKSFHTEPTILEALLFSYAQEIEQLKAIPELPALILPPINPRSELEGKLDLIARIVLEKFLGRSEKTSIENPNFPTTFRMLYELGRGSELMQSALIRLAEVPNDTEAMLIAALLSSEQEDNPLTARLWDMIFEHLQHPRDSMLAVYAKSLRDAERFEESSRFYSLYGERTDRGPVMRIEIALNLLAQGMPQDAIAMLRDAFECFERSVVLSDCYYMLGRAEKSLQFLLEAKRLDPKRSATVSFRLQLAARAEAVGDMETVESELLPLIQAKTDEAEIYNTLGYMFALRGYKLEDAEKYLKTALSMEPDSFAIMDSYAWLLYRIKKYAQAKEFIDKAIEKMQANPNGQDAVLLSHAGDIYYALGEKKQAENFWKKALLIRSDEVDYDGLEWKLRGGTPTQWENYMNMKNPVRRRQQKSPFR